AVGGGRVTDRAILEPAQHLAEHLDVLRGERQPGEGRGRKLVVQRLAGIEDETADASRPRRGGDLRVAAAGVVADERRVVEAERVERVGDEGAAALRREI